MFKVMKFVSTTCLAFSLCMASFTGHADPGGHGNSGNKGHGNKGHGNKEHGHAVKSHSHSHSGNKHYKGKYKSDRRTVTFSEQDRLRILNYYNTNPFQVSALPPGIAKNLARGKRLPPGIAKNYLPKDLLASLPSYPGYEYLAAGNDVLLVNSSTKIITDILVGLLK